MRTDPDSDAAKRTVIGIEEIKLHEGYNKKILNGASPNDIALIRVKEPIPFFNIRNAKLSNVVPICLPWSINDPGREIHDGTQKLKVLGWGQVTNNRIEAAINFIRNRAGVGILQQLDIPVISKRKCKEYDAFKNYTLLSTQLCAGGLDGKCIDFWTYLQIGITY